MSNLISRMCKRSGLLGVAALVAAAVGVLQACASDDSPILSAQPDAESEAVDADEIVYVDPPELILKPGDGLPEQLPSDLVWVTNDDDPTFASANAVRGGMFRTFMLTYPLTIRQVGPDSNGSFAGFVRYNNWGPVGHHPITRKPIPALATHWAYGADGRSVFYRLNPEARYSDGHPVTADDFVFAVRFMRSEQIVAPWYNEYYTERIRDVRKYDDYTIGIQGADAKPREEMHYNYAFGPVPEHFHRLSNKWISEYNWTPQPTTGPYHIGTIEKGKYIELKRTEDWWADDLRFYKHRFNPTTVRVSLIRDQNTAWQHFLKGDLDTFGIVMPQFWHDKAQGDEFDNGYIVKYWFYYQLPEPSIGMFMNTAKPLLEERDVRFGIAHSMNFQKVISTILRSEYDRLQTFQVGFGDYDNNSIRARTFDLDKAGEYFDAAGFSDYDGQGIRIRTRDDGQVDRLSFTVIYTVPAHTDRLVILKEEARKAGLELILQQLDGSSGFKQQQEKKHEISWGGWASQGLSPRYWEHFHSVNAYKPQTNNSTNTAIPEMDVLIDQFRASSDKAERVSLAHQLEQMVHDNGAFVPSFLVPYTREAAWRWVKLPEGLGTPTTRPLFNSQANSAGMFSSGGLFWIDEEEKAATLAAKADGASLGPMVVINEDFRN